MIVKLALLLLLFGHERTTRVVLGLAVVLGVWMIGGVGAPNAAAAANEPSRFDKPPGTEQRLIERLFKSYNRKLRPPGAVQVKFALNLNQIVNLNQKDQIMVLNAFIDHEWIDSRLSWGYCYFLSSLLFGL